MTLRDRLLPGALLGLCAAAALGRGELGADTEASALFAPAFLGALPVTLLVGILAAGGIARGGARGVSAALQGAVAALILGAMTAAALAPVTGGLGDPIGLIVASLRAPLGLGALALAAVLPLVVVARAGRGGQSRK